MNIAHACLAESEYDYNYNYENEIVTHSKILNLRQFPQSEKSGAFSNKDSVEIIEVYTVAEFIENQEITIGIFFITPLLALFGLFYILNNWNNLSDKKSLAIPLIAGSLLIFTTAIASLLTPSTCGASVTYTFSNPILNVLKALFLSLPALYALLLTIHIFRTIRYLKVLHRTKKSSC